MSEGGKALYERWRASCRRHGYTDEQIDAWEDAFDGSPEALALQDAMRQVRETLRRTLR